MAREEERFVTLLNRTIRSRWISMVKVVLASFVIIMTLVALLPPSFMAVGLVRVGFAGPGFGALPLNTIATEAVPPGLFKE